MTAAALLHLATSDRLARTVLRADGAMCMTLGTGTLIGAEPVRTLLGVGGAPVIGAVGTVVAAYGAWLCFRVSRGRLARRTVRAIAIADALWVVASVAALIEGVPAFSVEGRWVVALLALIVAGFGAAQFRSLQEMAQ